MKFAVQMLPLLFCLSAAGAFAGNDQCLDKAGSQSQINACMGSDFAAADAELNATYREVRKRFADDALFIQKLTTAQRAWIVFRDAQLETRFPAKDTAAEYGSAYPGCVAGEKAELTRARTAQLKRWLEGVEEGDVCAGSIPSKD